MNNTNSSKKYSSIQINCSASHIVNNLQITPNSLMFIHNSESYPRLVNIQNQYFSEIKDHFINYIPKLTKKNQNLQEIVTFKVLFLNNNNYYIGVGYYNTFKLFSLEGDKLLFQLVPTHFNNVKIYAVTSITEFSRKSTEFFDCILICDNYGDIFLINNDDSNWKKIQLTNETQNESEGIICCNTYKGYKYLGVCYESSKISLYNYENEKLQLSKNFNFKLPSLCCSMMKIKNEIYFVCGLMNGEIKIINCLSYNIVLSINSHIREITSMITVNNSIFTGSNDTTLNGFRINEDTLEVSKIINMEFEDKLIVGIVYNKIKKCIYVAVYDTPELYIINDINP